MREQGDALSKQMWLLYVTFEDFMHIQHPERSKQLLQTSVNVDEWIPAPPKTQRPLPSDFQGSNKSWNQDEMEKLDGTVSPKRDNRHPRVLKERKRRTRHRYSERRTSKNMTDMSSPSNENNHKYLISNDSKYAPNPNDMETQLCWETKYSGHRSNKKYSCVFNDDSDDTGEDEFFTSFSNEAVECRVAKKTPINNHKLHSKVNAGVKLSEMVSPALSDDYHEVLCPHSKHYSPTTISSGYSSDQDYVIAYDEFSDRLLCHQTPNNQSLVELSNGGDDDDSYIILADDKYENTCSSPVKTPFDDMKAFESPNRERIVYVSENKTDMEKLSMKTRKHKINTKPITSAKTSSSPSRKIAHAAEKIDNKLSKVTRSMKDIIHDLGSGSKAGSSVVNLGQNAQETRAHETQSSNMNHVTALISDTISQRENMCINVSQSNGSVSIYDQSVSVSCRDGHLSRTLSDTSHCEILDTDKVTVAHMFKRMSIESIPQPYDSGRSSMSDSLCETDRVHDFQDFISDSPLDLRTNRTKKCSSVETDNRIPEIESDSASLYRDDDHIYMTIPDDISETAVTPKFTPPPALPPRNKVSSIQQQKELDDTALSVYKIAQEINNPSNKRRNIYIMDMSSVNGNFPMLEDLTSQQEESGFVMGAKFVPAFFSPEMKDRENTKSRLKSHGRINNVQNIVDHMNNLNLDKSCANKHSFLSRGNQMNRLSGRRDESMERSRISQQNQLIRRHSVQVTSGQMSMSYDDQANETLTDQWAAALPANLTGTYC